MAKKTSNLRLGEWWDYTPYKLNQQSEAVLMMVILSETVRLLAWLYQIDRRNKR